MANSTNVKTDPQTVEATNVNVLNAARDYIIRMDISYENRIPEVTQENIDNIVANFTSDQKLQNALVPAMYGLISAQIVRWDTWQNPFNEVKGPSFPFGATEQDIWVNMAKGMNFDPLGGADRAYAIYRAYVMNVHHHVNFYQQYGVTITFDDLREAFLTEYGLRDLISAKIASLQKAANWDEYLCSLEVIESANNAGVTYPVTVSPITDEQSVLDLLVELQEGAMNMGFPSPEYNAAGADSSVENSSNIVLVTTPGVLARIRVYAQSQAFNEQYLRDPLRQIVVKKFRNPNTVAMLMDIRWFHIKDHFRTTSEQFNAASLNTNHFLTVSEMFSFSPYFACMRFTTDATSVDTITIADATANLGQQITLKIKVTGTNPLTTYSLELEGNYSPRTFIIPGTPYLQIGQDEKASTLTVKATSLYDNTKTSAATITINGN